MKTSQNYDLKIFLILSSVSLVFFLLIMAEIFAFENYKPSTLFTSPNQTDPVAQAIDQNKKNYKTQPLKAQLYITTQSLMVGSCTATVSIEKTIYPALNPIHNRLTALFEGPSAFEKSIGYTTPFEGWQQVFMGTTLQADGTLIVQFSEEVLDPASTYFLGKFDNECGRGIWEGIYLTAKEDNRVKYVVFSINNNPSSWNNLVKKYNCPTSEQENLNSPTQAQKQCQQPKEVI